MLRIGTFAVLVAAAFYITVQAWQAVTPSTTPAVEMTAENDGAIPVGEEENECVLDMDATLADLVHLITSLDKAEADWVIFTTLDRLGYRKES